MPEIKNTFIKSKMNKDLDSRLVPSGEYREGINISVSTSEGADVGALENIRGNVKFSDFGLTDDNLEVIGYYTDDSNDRMFLFITNYNDSSSVFDLIQYAKPQVTQTSPAQTRNSSKHYICYYSLKSNSGGVIVEGTFLNFSKTDPICGVNLLENLLFWTDNRNQPRKINVDRAIADPSYYYHEDHISVAKFAPYESIGFLKETNGFKELSMRNETDEWLPPFFTARMDNVSSTAPEYPVTFTSSVNSSFSNPIIHLGSSPAYNIKAENKDKPDSPILYVKNVGITGADVGFSLTISGPFVKVDDPAQVFPAWQPDDRISFSIENPDYNSNFAGDENFLEDKFMRFSYRFKYDDGEYSLMAPFSQIAFVPEQWGYFLENDDEETKESSIVNFMQNQIDAVDLVAELPISLNEMPERYKVDKIQVLSKQSDQKAVKVIAEIDDFETGIPDAITINDDGSGYTNGSYSDVELTGGSGSGFKADIVVSGGVIVNATIAASGEDYVIGDVLSVPSLGGSGSGGLIEVTSLDSKLFYKYQSSKPIKTLDEKEIIRVHDIVPIKAKTQEVVGNRVVYGNFLQNNETPDTLNYDLEISAKNALSVTDRQIQEFPNHTLKQNRTYQVGIVLVDRYGRASNVIVNDKGTNIPNQFNSTVYSDYTNGGSLPFEWFGNSLKVTFNTQVNPGRTKTYSGIYNESSNPLGWYSYRIVVKQQEQEYYNVYTPGALSGNIVFENDNTIAPPDNPWKLQYSNTSKTANISLFNDNINKVPRDLKNVGPSDEVYSTSGFVLYNRVYQLNPNSSPNALISTQNQQADEEEVISIRPFRELGDWTKYKNIDIRYYNEIGDGAGSGQFPDSAGNYTNPLYIYPGNTGSVDPLFLGEGKNPLVATLKTKSRIAFNAASQESTNFDFAKKLMVFETDPFMSNLDIYQETSTSELVQKINNATSGVTPSYPADLSAFVFSLDEGLASGAIATNTFEIIDNAGNFLNQQNATVELLSVKDQTGADKSSLFRLNLVTAGTPGSSPKYNIRTNAPLHWTKDSTQTETYNFSFGLKNNNNDKNSPVTKFYNQLTNLKPNFVTVRNGMGNVITPTPYVSDYTFQRSAFNEIIVNQGNILFGVTDWNNGGTNFAANQPNDIKKGTQFRVKRAYKFNKGYVNPNTAAWYGFDRVEINFNDEFEFINSIYNQSVTYGESIPVSTNPIIKYKGGNISRSDIPNFGNKPNGSEDAIGYIFVIEIVDAVDSNGVSGSSKASDEFDLY
jgi:hypothetical protein